MKKTCHSEFGTIATIFIKPVEDAFIDDAHLEKDWQALNFLSKPDLLKARKEYAAFEKLLSANNAAISYFQKDPELSMDALYCRDAAIATDFGMIICNMGKLARRKEPAAQMKSCRAVHLRRTARSRRYPTMAPAASMPAVDLIKGTMPDTTKAIRKCTRLPCCRAIPSSTSIPTSRMFSRPM